MNIECSTEFEQFIHIIKNNLRNLRCEYREGLTNVWFKDTYLNKSMYIYCDQYWYVEFTNTDPLIRISITFDKFELTDVLHGTECTIQDFDIDEYFQYSTIYPFSKEFYLNIKQIRNYLMDMKLI